MTYFPCHHHHCPNDASICLSSSCHFLSADSFLLGSTPHRWNTQASGVFLKVELAPCLINDWHLCQSIHSAAIAHHKSHLVGRSLEPSGDNDHNLAVYWTNTWPRSTGQPNLPNDVKILQSETCKTIGQREHHVAHWFVSSCPEALTSFLFFFFWPSLYCLFAAEGDHIWIIGWS